MKPWKRLYPFRRVDPSLRQLWLLAGYVPGLPSFAPVAGGAHALSRVGYRAVAPNASRLAMALDEAALTPEQREKLRRGLRLE